MNLINGNEIRQLMTSNRIFEALSQEIIRLELLPGTRLSEVEVSRKFSVSRQPVREAFIKLEDAHLVEIRPQRGSFVKLISQREVFDVRFIREAIEIAFVEKAIKNATAADFAMLDDIIAQQKKIPEHEHEAFLKLDDAFHRQIAEIAGCESAWSVLSRLKVQMDRVRFLSFPNTSPMHILIRQHEDIVSEMKNASIPGAVAAMKMHMEEILISLPKIAAENPSLFSD